LSRRTPAAPRPFRPFSDIDPERRNAILLLGGIGLVIVFALGLIAYGYYSERVAPKGETVLRIGGREFSYAYFERRLRSDLAQGKFQPSSISQGISGAIATIEREELVRIAARQEGVTATSEDVDAQLRVEFGLGEDVDHNGLAPFLRSELARVQLSLGDYLEIVRTRALEEKLRRSFADKLPAEGEQVDVLLIQAGSQANAIQAKQRLDQGESFESVARALSTDATKNDGGKFGWVPRGVLDPELEGVAFSISGRSDIIETKQDFYIIEVLAKQVRPIDDALRQEAGDRGLERLLRQAKEANPTENLLTEAQILRLARAIGALNA